MRVFLQQGQRGRMEGIIQGEHEWKKIQTCTYVKHRRLVYIYRRFGDSHFPSSGWEKILYDFGNFLNEGRTKSLLDSLRYLKKSPETNRKLIQVFFVFCGAAAEREAMASSFLRFLDHTQRRTTVGRTPLDE